jgi:hypothetical protein
MIDEGSEPVLMWDLDWLAGDDAAFEAHIVQQSSMALSSSERRATLIGQYGTAFFSTEQLDRVVRVTPLVLEGAVDQKVLGGLQELRGQAIQGWEHPTEEHPAR